MICKECSAEMTAQTVSNKITIWKCPLKHRYIEHPNRDKPYPHNFERK